MSHSIVGIGELLWDDLPSGRKLGGAPANFVYHAFSLGAEARLISRVGTDSAGREALSQLTRLGLSTECVELDRELPTGFVTVEVSGDGQPKFTIHENVAWDALSGNAAAERAVASADAVCFGTLAQRSEVSRNTIRRLLASARDSALRVLDVNLRAPFFSKELIEESLGLANLLKLNDVELPQLAAMFDLSGDAETQLRWLADRFGLRAIAFTCGAEGSRLYAQGEWSALPSLKIDVVDTVGAGDAFTAAVTLGLLAGWPLETIHHRANELAAFVCSQAGATPRLPTSLREAFATEEAALREEDSAAA